MRTIKVKCPAKINLDLKVLNKRPDGFHNIESTMQTIGLYDFLTVKVSKSQKTEIILSGNSQEIPYDEHNIVYKAALAFLGRIGKTAKIEVYIEKNIPVCAGLAGGSTDGAGVILALNALYGQILERLELHLLCAELGSDLNFCLEGGCKKATSRGEILTDLNYIERTVSLIKPINLSISAKEAYTKFSNKPQAPERENFVNDLEWAVIEDYEELKKIKMLYPNAVMTGSGPTFFAFDTEFQPLDGYWVKNHLPFVNNGCSIFHKF